MSAKKQRLLHDLDLRRLRGIELGPLDRPIVGYADGDVRYVDFLDSATLRRRHAHSAIYRADQIHVDYVWRDRSLKEVLGPSFTPDYIIASHVIEHAPDVLGWLKELTDVLSLSGQIRLAIPDKRFTFDFPRQPSSLAEVLAAFDTQARRPMPAAIFDFHLNYAKIPCQEAWLGTDVARSIEKQPLDLRLRRARQALADQGEEYHDIHCWVFTPKSFAMLCRDLCNLGLLDLACTCFGDTAFGTLEFFVSCQPIQDRDAMVESWGQMARMAHDHEPALLRAAVAAVATGNDPGDHAAQRLRQLSQPSLHSILPP